MSALVVLVVVALTLVMSLLHTLISFETVKVKESKLMTIASHSFVSIVTLLLTKVLL